MSYRDDDEFFEEVEEALNRKYGNDDRVEYKEYSDYDRVPNREHRPHTTNGNGKNRPQGTRVPSKGKITEEQEKRIAYRKLEERTGKKPTRKQKRLIDQKIHKKRKKERMNKFFKRLLVVVIAIVLLVCFLLFTKPGQKILLRIVSLYAKVQMNEADEEDSEAIPFKSPEDIPEDWAQNDDVINILLIGVDATTGERSNTDSMILCSENLKTGQITLVSFLRDTYVDIYGMDKKQKLNYAYRADGIGCLIGTIESTYKIYIDSYAIVDFDSFINVVDKLGGLDIELTQEEVDYLNNTDLITKEENRNLVAGVNHLNGDQAMGYCRVRAVGTKDDDGNTVIDDHGRTLRQRKVLRALFDKYKNEDLLTVYKTTNSILGSITTPMSSGNIYTLLEGFYFNDSKTLNQMQIPAMEKFSYQSISGVGSVVSIDGYTEENIQILRDALYGDLDY